MAIYAPRIFRNRTAVLAICAALVLVGALTFHAAGKNHLDSKALPATSTQVSANNQKVQGATTIATNSSNPSNKTNTNGTTKSATNTSGTGAAATQSSSSGSTKSATQTQQITGSNTQPVNTEPVAPVQPVITFSADACQATASGAAGDLFILAVQDGPTVETSYRGAGVASEIVPASGTLTLATGVPFDTGTTYSIAQIKDSEGNLITQKIVPLTSTCS